MTEISAKDLSRCANGDPGALGRIYDTFSNRIYRTALHVTGQSADAEDIVQDLFVGLPAKITQFDGRSKFSTWLYRMTVNLSLNLLKRRRLAPTELDGGADEHRSTEPTPLRLVERDDASEQCHALLARLPERDRTILALREIEELSYREIASVLGVAEGTVMSRLARARSRFGALVRRVGDELQEARR